MSPRAWVSAFVAAVVTWSFLAACLDGIGAKIFPSEAAAPRGTRLWVVRASQNGSTRWKRTFLDREKAIAETRKWLWQRLLEVS